MSKGIKIGAFTEKITLILLFLFSISLFNLAGFILAGIFLFYFVITLRTKYYIDKKTVTLFLFSTTFLINYALFWPVGIKEIIIFFIAPWAAYLFGKEFVMYSADDNMINKITVIIFGGFFLHGTLNLYSYLSSFGLGSIYRVAIDFWRDEIISVTGCALYYVPMISLGIGYIFFGTKFWIKLLSSAFIAIGMFANVIYSNRTAVYLIGILIVISVGISLLKTNAKISSWIKFILVLLLIFIAWIIDLWGIQTRVMNLSITKRILGSDVGRFEVWNDFITSEWWQHPFGGEQYTLEYEYAHNLWLDTLYSVGFAPFIFLLIFTIMAFSTVKEFYKLNTKNGRIYLIFVLGVVISFMVEPIMSANPYYFIMMLITIGGMEGYNKRLKNDNSVYK